MSQRSVGRVKPAAWKSVALMVELNSASQSTPIEEESSLAHHAKLQSVSVKAKSTSSAWAALKPGPVSCNG